MQNDELSEIKIEDQKIIDNKELNNRMKYTYSIYEDINNQYNLDVIGILSNYYDNIRIINFAGFEADGTTPTFTFNRPDNDEAWDIDDAGINSSRWQAQFGVRYIF